MQRYVLCQALIEKKRRSNQKYKTNERVLNKLVKKKGCFVY